MEAADHISLGLRLALLESLTLGDNVSQTITRNLPLWKSTLLLRSHTAQCQFLENIEKYKPIVQFVKDYKDNSTYLQPSSSLTSNFNSTTTNISEEKNSKEERGDKKEELSSSLLSTQSIIALLLESEPDLRQLERDLQMCESYYQRNTAGAGKLAGG